MSTQDLKEEKLKQANRELSWHRNKLKAEMIELIGIYNDMTKEEIYNRCFELRNNQIAFVTQELKQSYVVTALNFQVQIDSIVAFLEKLTTGYSAFASQFKEMKRIGFVAFNRQQFGYFEIDLIGEEIYIVFCSKIDLKWLILSVEYEFFYLKIQPFFGKISQNLIVEYQLAQQQYVETLMRLQNE